MEIPIFIRLNNWRRMAAIVSVLWIVGSAIVLYRGKVEYRGHYVLPCPPPPLDCEQQLNEAHEMAMRAAYIDFLQALFFDAIIPVLLLWLLMGIRSFLKLAAGRYPSDTGTD